MLVEDKEYYETLEIIRGHKKLPAIFSELKVWLKEIFNITAYNFIFRRIEHNNPDNRYELYILLSSKSEYNSMFKDNRYDVQKQNDIAEKLMSLARKYDSSRISYYENAWICYNNFHTEIKTDFNRRAYQIIGKALTEKYAGYSLWSIQPAFDAVVVFYYHETDIKKNWDSGISKQIETEYFEELRKIDEFNVFKYDSFGMTFDSKENVDKNYEGNLYYYFK